jgi:YHS domain-containing protein
MSLPAPSRRVALVCARIIFVLGVGAWVSAVSATILPPVVGTTELYASERLSGVALDGFDPVSYRLEATPRPGRPDHEYLWRGLAWRFASAANRAAFVRDPETFAPRIGGYDAERAASNVVVPGDPEIFLVRSGGLYLFRSEDHRRRFRADEDLANRAEASWQRLLPGLVQG